VPKRVAAFPPKVIPADPIKKVTANGKKPRMHYSSPRYTLCLKKNCASVILWI